MSNYVYEQDDYKLIREAISLRNSSIESRMVPRMTRLDVLFQGRHAMEIEIDDDFIAIYVCGRFIEGINNSQLRQDYRNRKLKNDHLLSRTIIRCVVHFMLNSLEGATALFHKDDRWYSKYPEITQCGNFVVDELVFDPEMPRYSRTVVRGFTRDKNGRIGRREYSLNRFYSDFAPADKEWAL